MRAFTTGLALAVTFVLSGCIAPHGRAPSGSPAVLSASADYPLADALAHYSQALIDDATPGGAERALAHWRAAVEADPTNIALRLKLGGVLLSRREVGEATRVLEKGRDLAPRSADMRLILGGAYQISGRTRPAIREFEALIRLAPDHPDGYVRLAALEIGRGARDRALAVLDKGMAHPGAALTVLQFCENMGRLYLANNQLRDAIACFEHIQRRLPDNLPVREVLARCYALAGDPQRAIAGLMEVVRRDPRNGEVEFYLGDIYDELNDAPSAASHFERATQLSPNDARPYLRLAFLQLARDRAGAMATLQRALDKVPDEPAIHAYIGLVYSRDRQYEKAIECFAKAEAMSSKAGDKRIQPQFYFWYGAACEQAGHFERAEALLEQCIALSPESDEALNYLAYMWADRGVNLDKALDYVQRALKLNPDDGAYLDTLGWIRYRRGEYEQALEAQQDAVRLMPGDATVSDHMGDIMQALGQAREARRFWLQSLKVKADQPVLRAKLQKHGINADSEPSAPK